jgi:hypothetical protein
MMGRAAVSAKRTARTKCDVRLLVFLTIALGGNFVARPRGEAWPGQRLGAAEMLATVGGIEGYKCIGENDCFRSCDNITGVE